MSDDEKDLILRPPDDEPKPKAKPKKPRTKATPEDVEATTRLEQVFKAGFERRWGFPIGRVLYQPIRDRALLKRTLQELGEAEAASYIQAFFDATDPKSRTFDSQISRTRSGGVVDFRYWLPRLILLRNGRTAGRLGTVHPRTAENLSEAIKATGKDR